MTTGCRIFAGLVLALAVMITRVETVCAQAAVEAVDEGERLMQEYRERVRSGRVVGSGESLAIELPDGSRIPLGRGAACRPSEVRGGLARVSCTEDGPVYYFDAATRDVIEMCRSWVRDVDNCPPRQWPIEFPDCDGSVPQGIRGTWTLHSHATNDGFEPNAGGSGFEIRIEERSLLILSGIEPREFAYTLVSRAGSRFVLELRDDDGASTQMVVETAPCGLIVAADQTCDRFCHNRYEDFTEEEVLEAIATSAPGQLRSRMLLRARANFRDPTLHTPMFPDRSYFRRVEP